jgi:hypothetical protein
MLSGVLPFPGPDFLAQKERLHFIPVSRSAPGLPPGADAFLGEVLQPDPAKRPASAIEFLDGLKKL